MMKAKKFTELEIKSGNKLIAEFMVGKPFISKSGIYVHEKVFIIENRERLIDNLEYHSSWNALMPVRYKIQEIGAHLEIEGTRVLYAGGIVQIKQAHFQRVLVEEAVGQNKETRLILFLERCIVGILV